MSLSSASSLVHQLQYKISTRLCFFSLFYTVIVDFAVYRVAYVNIELLKLELPNDAYVYMILSQIPIGCSLLRKENCELIDIKI